MDLFSVRGNFATFERGGSRHVTAPLDSPCERRAVRASSNPTAVTPRFLRAPRRQVGSRGLPSTPPSPPAPPSEPAPARCGMCVAGDSIRFIWRFRSAFHVCDQCHVSRVSVLMVRRPVVWRPGGGRRAGPAGGRRSVGPLEGGGGGGSPDACAEPRRAGAGTPAPAHEPGTPALPDDAARSRRPVLLLAVRQPLLQVSRPRGPRPHRWTWLFTCATFGNAAPGRSGRRLSNFSFLLWHPRARTARTAAVKPYLWRREWVAITFVTRLQISIVDKDNVVIKFVLRFSFKSSSS